MTGSAAAQWLQERRLRFEGLTDLPLAMAALESGKLDAVVYDSPILRSLTTEGGEITVLPQVLRTENYAFALPLGSPLRKDVNRALLEALETETWLALRHRYLGR